MWYYLNSKNRSIAGPKGYSQTQGTLLVERDGSLKPDTHIYVYEKNAMGDRIAHHLGD